jgi:hypothetical protein
MREMIGSFAPKVLAASIAALLFVGALTGCSSEGSGTSAVFDALGSGVDPYASNFSDQASSASSANTATSTSSSASSTTTVVTSASATADVSSASQESTAATVTTDTTVVAASSAEEVQQTEDTSHYEGENVNITGTGNGTTIYATWQKDSDGDWAAVFLTNNYTTIYSYYDGSTWTFYTADGQPVTHTAFSSLETGNTGPLGEESYWQNSNDPNTWY